MSNKELKLSDKKARWVKNRKVILRGSRLNYNASLETWYRRQLKKLTSQMTMEVKQALLKLFKKLPVKPLGTTDESISSQARILMNKLTEKFESLFALESKTLADTMMQRTLKSSETNLKSSLKELSGGLSIKTSIVPPELTDVINASIAENVSLIKSIPSQYFKDITGSVMRSITTGQGMYDLLPQIKKYEGITERRAELIALDQTRKAYTSVNTVRLNKKGVKKFEWIHSGGGQTPRESHLKIDGEIFSFENLEAEQAAKGVPKEDRGLPGYPVNCFVGSTKVSLANGCVNMWRYNHTGPVITFEVQGSSITSTINHPILTHRGWLLANEIEEGDYLVSSMLNNENVIEDKETKDITTFDNIFNTLEGERSFEFGPKFNFHGDIPKTQVETIRANDLLPERIETFSAQQIENFIFALTNIVINAFGLSFNAEIFKLGCTCGRRQSDSFFSAEFAHSGDICFACITQNDAVVRQDTIYNLPAGIPIFRQLQSTNAGVITIADILSVGINKDLFLGGWNDVIKSSFESFSKMGSAGSCTSTKSFQTYSAVQRFLRVNKKIISEFSGHVYTLQSRTGWYSVTSTEIISKNCRCTMKPVIDYSDED